MGKVSERKQEICTLVKKMVGHDVVGLSDTLSILTSPDVLPLLKSLVSDVEKEASEKDVIPIHIPTPVEDYTVAVCNRKPYTRPTEIPEGYRSVLCEDCARAVVIVPLGG